MHSIFLLILYPDSQERAVSLSIVKRAFKVKIGGKRGIVAMGMQSKSGRFMDRNNICYTKIMAWKKIP
jgi:hypothetical protein